jgi:hypothetical protein
VTAPGPAASPIVRPMTPAVGHQRGVPAPDPIARDYLLLALRLDQRIPGIVDGYYGPADLKAQVDLEQLATPLRLADDAAALRERVATEVGEPDRRAWLTAQLIALEANARAFSGAPEGLVGPAYEAHVAACFDRAPVRRNEAVFAEARTALEVLLPGPGPLGDRLARWDASLVIPAERLPALVERLVGRFRAQAAQTFGLPAGEELRVAFVTGQPWTGYNWFDGGRRSRVDLNTDLPARVPDLVSVVAHETYPGHHLEHAWKEAHLVDGLGRLEASALLINTPECLVSEGLADLGRRFAVPAGAEPELLAELLAEASSAGSSPVGSPASATSSPDLLEFAARVVAVRLARARLAESAVDAALMRHVDGRSHEQVGDWLVETALLTPERAEKRLEFIEHPLWRTYVFVYYEGEALLRRWLEAVPEPDRAARFRRLLLEQLTPTAIATELGVGASLASPPTRDPTRAR